MKSIYVRILAGLITFLIGWSCAKLNFIHLAFILGCDCSSAKLGRLQLQVNLQRALHHEISLQV